MRCSTPPVLWFPGTPMRPSAPCEDFARIVSCLRVAGLACSGRARSLARDGLHPPWVRSWLAPSRHRGLEKGLNPRRSGGFFIDAVFIAVERRFVLSPVLTTGGLVLILRLRFEKSLPRRPNSIVARGRKEGGVNPPRPRHCKRLRTPARCHWETGKAPVSRITREPGYFTSGACLRLTPDRPFDGKGDKRRH